MPELKSKEHTISDSAGASSVSRSSSSDLISATSIRERENSQSQEKSKMLVICIDRDNDVGLKTGIETPIVGRDACLDAAMKLGMADPEEADANAIFAAVKEYEELVSKGQDCEVVTVGGLFERGVLGDKKIRTEVARVLEGYPASEAVVVSDGVEGEELSPVISPLVPIVSIRKVIIKHSKSVEESYLVLGRYLRMLLSDPRYSKYALGVPGIFIIGAAIAYYFGGRDAPLVLVALIGIIFVIRGFNVDREIESVRNLTAVGYVSLFANLISVIIVISGIAQGVYAFFNPGTKPYIFVTTANLSNPTLYVPKIIGYFIQYSQFLIWLGLAVYVAVAIFFNLFRPKHLHVMRSAVALIVLGLLYYPVYQLGQVLISPGATAIPELVGISLFLLAVSFVVAAYIYSRTGRRVHAESEEAED